MKNAQKPDHVSLAVLLGRAREGRFVVPDFQREFEWMPWDIRDLVRSIFLDYYIGSLLLWKSKPQNYQALSCEGIYAYQGVLQPEHIVLDGQQRLTAMFYAFTAPDLRLPNRQNRFYYWVRVDQFMAGQYDDAFHYSNTTKALEDLLANPSAQYENHMFLCAVIGDPDMFALPNWVQGYRQYWEQRAVEPGSSATSYDSALARHHAENGLEFGKHVQSIMQEYQISFIELDEDLEIDKVCDIFTQLNSRGVRLDVFDLMNALLKPKGLQLKHMWRDAEKRLAFTDSARMNVYVLQVMSILRQAYCSPKYLYYLLPGAEKTTRHPDGKFERETLVQSSDQFRKLWDDAVDTLETAIGVLSNPQEFGASSAKFIPYLSIIPAFASLQAIAAQQPTDRRFAAQRKVRHWYWASVFSNRYSSAVESTAASDSLAMRAWFEDDSREPGFVHDFGSQLRELNLHAQVRYGTAIYNGVFNLLVMAGARDWYSGTVPSPGQLDDHHIVPAAWGRKSGIDSRINSILNRTPLTADTNRTVIGDQLPNAYLPKMIEHNGEDVVRKTMSSHFISSLAVDILLRNPFTVEDFDQFIAERRRTILEAIQERLIGDKIDLSPTIKALDSQIEAIELSLRQAIDDALTSQPELIPSHVAQKLDDRLKVAQRRVPVNLAGHTQTLASRLEYADLRDLEDIILAKGSWTVFESRFVNKEALKSRFGQLAELRNRIRHSRAIDEISRKDGEAAILWFQQVIHKPKQTDVVLRATFGEMQQG